jgi:F0F1-type ATP synthase membrane subunit b/b'
VKLTDVEQEYKKSLEGCQELIEEAKDQNTPEGLKAAMVAQGQLARRWEKFYQKISESEPEEPQERNTPAASQRQILESVKALLHQHAERLGYTRV